MGSSLCPSGHKIYHLKLKKKNSNISVLLKRIEENGWRELVKRRDSKKSKGLRSKDLHKG